MSLATAGGIREQGNLVDTLDAETQIDPHIPIATAQLRAYIGVDIYEAIIRRDDDSFTEYNSVFLTDTDDWEQNIGDASLELTAGESVAGYDNCLKVFANGSDLDFRIKNDEIAPVGGHAYRMRLDYWAEKNCGLKYLSMEATATERSRDPYGILTGIPIVEEAWQVGQVIKFLGFGNLTLSAYTSPGGIYEDNTFSKLANGTAIYFNAVSVEYLNDREILTIAENRWALGLLMEPLAIHCAGDGLAFMGGVGDGRYQYIDPTMAAQMGRRYIAEAKALVALWVPPLDTVGDGRNQVFATGKVDMVAV